MIASGKHHLMISTINWSYLKSNIFNNIIRGNKFLIRLSRNSSTKDIRAVLTCAKPRWNHPHLRSKSKIRARRRVRLGRGAAFSRRALINPGPCAVLIFFEWIPLSMQGGELKSCNCRWKRRSISGGGEGGEARGGEGEEGKGWEIAGDSVETRPRNVCESCGEPWELRRHWIEIRERYRPRAAAALISDRALARRPLPSSRVLSPLPRPLSVPPSFWPPSHPPPAVRISSLRGSPMLSSN